MAARAGGGGVRRAARRSWGFPRRRAGGGLRRARAAHRAGGARHRRTRGGCRCDLRAGRGGPLVEALAAKRAEETRLRQTVAGPHRDDLAIALNGMEAARFASEGSNARSRWRSSSRRRGSSSLARGKCRCCSSTMCLANSIRAPAEPARAPAGELAAPHHDDAPRLARHVSAGHDFPTRLPSAINDQPSTSHVTDTEAHIALKHDPRLGPVRLRRLTDALGTPQRILAATEAELRDVNGIGPEAAEIHRGLGAHGRSRDGVETRRRLRSDGDRSVHRRITRRGCGRFTIRPSSSTSGASSRNATGTRWAWWARASPRITRPSARRSSPTSSPTRGSRSSAGSRSASTRRRTRARSPRAVARWR